MKIKLNSFIAVLLINIGIGTYSSAWAQDSSKKTMDLQTCIGIALKNQPQVKQAEIDQKITERDIASSLSAWYPQLNATANLQHYLILPLANIGGKNVQTAQTNTSGLSLQADQQILNASLIQASRASKYMRTLSQQTADNVKINTVVNVTKAYYDLLTSREQINIINENILRTQKQLKDATAKYNAGIVDKIDEKRAYITLANTQADKKRAETLMVYKIAYLKQLMGMGDKDTVNIAYTAIQPLEQELTTDTTAQVDYNNRIEYQSLKTQKNIQIINTKYNKWLFLPSLSAFVNYNMNYRNNAFSNLYQQNYPGSIVGLNLSFPIFQGGKRNQQLRKSQLMEQRLDLDLENMQNSIHSQYEQAMAVYKANINDWKTAKGNVSLSKEVYETLKLQYQEGIKTYLDLMTAETDLRTAQLNYLNSLYNVLASKIDVDQALGKINTTND